MSRRGASEWAALGFGVAALVLGFAAALTGAAVLAGAAGLAGLAAGTVTFGLSTEHTTHKPLPADSGRDQLSSPDPLPGSALNELASSPAASDGAAGSERRSRDATDDSSGFTDPESGLYSAAYFHVALGWRLASARRHLRPVAVAVIDLIEGLPGQGDGAPPSEHVAEAIARTLRDADLACRLGDGRYALIMEDTPESGAIWTVERLRRMLVGRFGSHTTWAGIACYPAHALDSDELLAQASAALVAAHDWPQDRIEVALPFTS